MSFYLINGYLCNDKSYWIGLSWGYETHGYQERHFLREKCCSRTFFILEHSRTFFPLARGILEFKKIVFKCKSMQVWVFGLLSVWHCRLLPFRFGIFLLISDCMLSFYFHITFDLGLLTFLSILVFALAYVDVYAVFSSVWLKWKCVSCLESTEQCKGM